jgi:conjugal transfer/entry exclusion protein
MDRLENTVTSANSEIDRINNTLSTLKTVKDNMQDMASLINSMPYEVDTYKYMQYASLLQKTLDSDTSFDLKYETVYNHKFL